MSRNLYKNIYQYSSQQRPHSALKILVRFVITNMALSTLLFFFLQNVITISNMKAAEVCTHCKCVVYFSILYIVMLSKTWKLAVHHCVLPFSLGLQQPGLQRISCLVDACLPRTLTYFMLSVAHCARSYLARTVYFVLIKHYTRD